MSMPATDGPTSLAALTIDELSAIAFGRSSRLSTISIRNAWRAGMSTALMSPWKMLSRTMWVTVIVPERAKAARSPDWIIASTWVTTSTRCRFHRSTHTPAKGARMKVGIWPVKLTSPRSNAEWVRR